MDKTNEEKKKRSEEIVDEAYNRWVNDYWNGKIYPYHGTKLVFIERIKNDSWFSDRWGLKIEETIFDILERSKLAPENNLMEVRDNVNILGFYCDDDLHSFLDKHNVPRKFVTYYYNNEKIEVYE